MSFRERERVNPWIKAIRWQKKVLINPDDRDYQLWFDTVVILKPWSPALHEPYNEITADQRRTWDPEAVWHSGAREQTSKGLNITNTHTHTHRAEMTLMSSHLRTCVSYVWTIISGYELLVTRVREQLWHVSVGKLLWNCSQISWKQLII